MFVAVVATGERRGGGDGRRRAGGGRFNGAGGFGVRGLAHAHAGLALFAEGQLHFLGGGVQVRVAESPMREPGRQQRQRVGHAQVLGDVLGGKAQQKAQMRLIAQHHGAHHHALQVRPQLVDVGHAALVGHQHQLLQALVGLGLAQQVGKARQVRRVELGHIAVRSHGRSAHEVLRGGRLSGRPPSRPPPSRPPSRRGPRPSRGAPSAPGARGARPWPSRGPPRCSPRGASR